jgi:arylsulfatase A-like enzyme
LLIHVPGLNQGRHISELAQQADLLPTILDLIGVEVPNWTDGMSLKPALEENAHPVRFVFSMNLESARIFDPIAKGTMAVMDDEFKYVLRLDTQEETLYRYKTDRLEENNLVVSSPEVAQHLRGMLLNRLELANKRFTTKQ